MAASASASARQAFALDTIGRLRASAESAIRDEFTEPERLLLGEIMAGVESLSAAELKRKIHELNDIQCQDEIRAIEFDPSVIDLFCALDNWADYRLTNNPACVAEIAINMVNAIDHNFGGDAADYSIDNMLGAPEMAAEHRRQKSGCSSLANDDDEPEKVPGTNGPAVQYGWGGPFYGAIFGANRPGA